METTVGHQLSVTYASLLIRRCLGHLERYGIEPGQVTVQTDRGAEFGGGQRKKRDFGFIHTVERVCGAEQVFTSPRWPNANADVEAVHRLIEEELFDLETFADLEDFLGKVTVYQHFFNYARTNSYKGRKTPWDIVQADHDGIRPEVLALPPVLLESEFERIQQVGQDVPGLDALGVGRASDPACARGERGRPLPGKNPHDCPERRRGSRVLELGVNGG